MARKLALNLKETKWARLLQPVEAKSVSSCKRSPSTDQAQSINDALVTLEEEDQTQRFTFIATYSALIRKCTNSGSYADGMLVHDHIRRSGYSTEVVLCELLIQMYGKCKRVPEARLVFDQMRRRSVYSWNLMLGAYVENGLSGQALELYRKMDLEPDKFTFSTVLMACSQLGSLEDGKKIHQQMKVRNELIPDTVSNNSLITMYAKCGRLDEAKAVFDGIKDKNPVSWNCMMAAYAQHGHISGYTQLGNIHKAIELYHHMDSQGVKKNMITFSTALSACASLGRESLGTGQYIHSQLVSSGLERNVIVDTALLTMYGACGNLDSAKQVFNTMRERNVVTWTVMVSALSQHGHNQEAIKLLQKMDLEGVTPNACTLSCILGACANIGDLQTGKLVHSRAKLSGFDTDITFQNALINMYAKCGRLEVAERLFNSILTKTDASWNSMIAAYVQNGLNKEAFHIYNAREAECPTPNDYVFASIIGACSTIEELAQIHEKVVHSKFCSDIVTHNSLIKMYSKLGSPELARRTFNEMTSRADSSWNGMIAGYVQNSLWYEAFELYEEMKSKNVGANAITFANILTACLISGSVKVGESIHLEVQRLGLDRSDAIVGTVLVNMYAKFGNLVAAREAFDNLSDRNIISWNAMMMAYAQNGRYEEAVKVFHAMFLEGLQADNISFTCILHALSHAGFLDRGRTWFLSMGEDHGVEPTLDHYVSMVDLLGRSGRLMEAVELVRVMPFEPDVMSWMTLLGGCKLHGNIESAKYAAQRTVELDIEDPSPYILLSNIYSAYRKEDTENEDEVYG